MSWISPTFSDEGFFTSPAKKAKTSQTPKTESWKVADIQTPSSNWLQQYKPNTVNELAVHVKKVKELEAWLEHSKNVKSLNKFLLLTGPSGCAKTTTLHTLCSTKGFKVFEWITPLDKTVDDSHFLTRTEFSKSAVTLFQEYLFRSSRYNSCLTAIHTRKLILVKDFPNVFLHNPSTFHEMMENFHEKCMYPVVFICSNESLARKLFPATLKASCAVETITFNPLPDQRVFKVLKSILSKEIKTNKNITMLKDDVLSAICAACGGDLRSAISKLSFCSINSGFNITKSQGKFKKPKSVKEDSPIDKDNRIDFFRGVGRVLYPKKIENAKDVRFVHSTEEVVENFLCEPNSFINQLHENYPSKFGNIKDLSDSAEKLAKSDMLMARWQERDVFHQYSLAVAVQGLMVCNRSPQKARFEAFKKSQTSRVQIDSKSFELEGKALFSDLRILDYQSLIDILPYSRFLLPNLNPGQMEYVRKTCHFKCY